MTEKGTGENAGAVVSGHEMVVTYEPSMHGFRCEPVCHEPAGADLPPRWDGRIVHWSEWDTSPTFVCGPRGPVRASRCEGCGSTASNATSRGTVYPLAGDTYESEQPIVKRTRSGREYQAGVQVVTANWLHPVTSLVAFRCLRCGLDEVLDMHSAECWTLDDSDYGDKGSTA